MPTLFWPPWTALESELHWPSETAGEGWHPQGLALPGSAKQEGQATFRFLLWHTCRLLQCIRCRTNGLCFLDLLHFIRGILPYSSFWLIHLEAEVLGLPEHGIYSRSQSGQLALFLLKAGSELHCNRRFQALGIRAVFFIDLDVLIQQAMDNAYPTARRSSSRWLLREL